MSTGRSKGGYTLFPNCARKPSSELKTDRTSRKPSPPPTLQPASSQQQYQQHLHAVRTSDGSASHRERVKSSLAHLDHPSLMGHERKCLQSTRLIPLKLSSAPVEERRSSFHLPYSISPSEPIKPIRRKSRPTVVTGLCELPFSEKEWKATMHEVRSLYLREQYKTCSSRCKALCDRMKVSSHNILYHIYLSAYRASSLEMIAFNLPSYSTEKMLLYYEARGSYENAISQLEYTSLSEPALSTIPDYPTRSSSARSSIDSIFSQYSKSSSTASVSPSIESSQISEKRTSNPQQRPKKKVSFSLSIDTSAVWPNESEDYHHALSSPTQLLDFFPTPPSGSCSPIPPTPPTISKPCLTKTRNSVEYVSPPPLPLSRSQRTSFPGAPNPKKLAHLLRYHNVLTTLRSQLTEQKEDVQGIIEKSSTSPPRAKREVTSPFNGSIPDRTERLREMNLSRKRFDSLRYQKLCERALSELHA
ncbi:hypothetical protein K3495_g3564 [Podosphaera aphanis]|nr:hypothetical protein K3495_g3564 [Podosphaera aphanis]